MSYEERARELGLPLEVELPTSSSYYLPFTRVGRIVYLSGRTSTDPTTGAVLSGRVGADISVEEGQEAARLAMTNCILTLRQAAGSLNSVQRILRVTGYVNAAPDFTQQPEVMNAASALLVDLFGDAGRHARTSVGVGCRLPPSGRGGRGRAHRRADGVIEP